MPDLPNDQKKGGARAQAAAKGGADNQAAAKPTPPKLVWTDAEIKQNIKRREHQLNVARKQHAENTETAQRKLEESIVNYSKGDFVRAEKSLIECEAEIVKIVNPLSPIRKAFYFISIWGLFPISYAFAGLATSFLVLWRFSNVWIMGVVPVWAPLVAVIGGSVQIFAGVVLDYKKDDMITDYKSLWYLIILPVSFAFGFIAIFLINAGLITVTQGQFGINQSLNQTLTTVTLNQTLPGVTNQTATSVATVTQPTGSALALPLVLCFLAGYATEWFMSLLSGLEKLVDTTGKTSRLDDTQQSSSSQQQPSSSQ